MLARLERPDGLIGVLVMPRRDDDEIDARIAKHLIEIGGEDLDLVVAREVAGVRGVSRDDGPEEEPIAPLLHLRHQHRRAKRAGADQRVLQRSGGRLAMAAHHDTRRVSRLREIARVVRVANHHAQRQRTIRGRQLAIRRRRFIDGDDAIDERLHVEAAPRDQIEVRLQVPVERPADVRKRVVAPLDLVRGVVPAGPIRRAHQQIDFLAVEDLALHFQPDVADDDDRAFRARHVHREVHDGARLRGGSDQSPVGAATCRHVTHQRLERVGVGCAPLHP